MRLSIGTRAVFQTKQPLGRKPSVRPLFTVRFAQPVAGPFLPLAQHRPKASPQPSIRSTQTRRMALSEVAIPSPQDRVELTDHLRKAPPVGASRQRPQFVLQFLKALLARPFLAPAKVPAQKVKAFRGRVYYPRLGRMQGQPCGSGPFAQKRQHRFGFFFRPAQNDKVVRVAHHLPSASHHFLIQRVEIQVCQQRTDHRSLRGAPLGRLPALNSSSTPALRNCLSKARTLPSTTRCRTNST